jgi:hypothetical protein
MAMASIAFCMFTRPGSLKTCHNMPPSPMD